MSERIAQFTGDARIVYIMRDPVERSISHYWHMVRYHSEWRSMRTAILSDPQFRDVSHYALQLTPYFARFGPERVFTLTFEELTRHTDATMRRLYGWLGVDPHAASPMALVSAENVTPTTVAKPAHFGALQLVRQSTPVRRIAPHLPRAIRSSVKRLATIEVERSHVDTSEVIDFLRPIQRRQTEVLAAMLARDFPDWKTLYGQATSDGGLRRGDGANA